MDAMDWTPGECCRKSASICDQEDMTACVVIMLDRGAGGNEFNTQVRISGLRLSEVIALLEIKKADIMRAILE